MNTNTLQYRCYERASGIKYQLGAVVYLLTELQENDCNRKSHAQLHGVSQILEGIRAQVDDLVQALDSLPPELMTYESELKGHPADQCLPSLKAIAQEAWEKRKKAPA